MQAAPLLAAIASLVVAGIAVIADRRAVARDDLSRGVLVPWPQVMLAALIAALLFVILAVRGG